MRTLFEDTNVRADIDDGVKGSGNKYLLIALWCVAIAFLAGTWGVYRWANSRPAPTPPPPPVSLQDLKQVSTAFSAFNGFVRDDKWIEAEAMLSTTARQQLTVQNKTLRDGLFGKLANLKLTATDPTPSIEKEDPNTFKQDFVYVFTDDQYTKSEQTIISLALIIENGKIVINSWGDPKQPEKSGK